MTNELLKRTEGELLLNPVTGEVIELSAPLPTLARVLDSIRELESQLREQKAKLSREVHGRFDSRRSWTAQEGGWELRGESDAPRVEWDGKALYEALCDLHREGEIEESAIAAAVEIVPVSFKPRQRGINALLKNPKLAERLGPLSTITPAEERTRRLSVRRLGGAAVATEGTVAPQDPED